MRRADLDMRMTSASDLDRTVLLMNAYVWKTNTKFVNFTSVHKRQKLT